MNKIGVTEHKRETEKTALANKIIQTLIWYGFYYLRSGNGVGPILTAPEPTRASQEVTVQLDITHVTITDMKHVTDETVNEAMRTCTG